MSILVECLTLAIAAGLLYGNTVLALRGIKKTKKGVKSSYGRIFTLKTLDKLPIVSLGTLIILFWFSPFGIPDLAERVRFAHNFGIQIERPITAVTHAFIHANFDHFLGNAFSSCPLGSMPSFSRGKRWQLATIVIAMPLGMLAIYVYEFVIGREPEEPVLGSSIFLFAMIVVSVSGIARYCFDRIRGDSSQVTSLATAVIATAVIFAADTKFFTDWIVSQVGHFLGLTSGVLILSVRAIYGGTEMVPETRGHLDKLAFIYEKRWSCLSAGSFLLARIVRAKFSKR